MSFETNAQPTKLDALETLGSDIAIESFEKINVPGIFKGFVATVLDGFKFSSSFVDVAPIEQLPKNQREFLSLIKSLPYTAVGELNGITLEGMSAYWLDMLKVLVPLSEQLSTIESTTVAPYTDFLARFVSDKKFSQSTQNDKKIFQKNDERRKRTYAEFGKMYKKGSVETTARIKTLVARNGDWEKVFREINQVIANFEKVDRKAIKAHVKQSSDYIEIILEEFSKVTDRKVSQEAAAQLSNYAYDVGRELELFSTTYYRVLALRSAIEATIEKIKTTFGD